MNILFVDDAPDMRHIFSTVFVLEGHHTKIAKNGVDAIEAVRWQTFDAIVMDVEMPQMDGIEATRRIRQLPHGKNVPIVMFTGYGDSGYDRKALEAGANAVLYKPLLPKQLLDQISSRNDLAAPRKKLYAQPQCFEYGNMERIAQAQSSNWGDYRRV